MWMYSLVLQDSKLNTYEILEYVLNKFHFVILSSLSAGTNHHPIIIWLTSSFITGSKQKSNLHFLVLHSSSTM